MASTVAPVGVQFTAGIEDDKASTPPHWTERDLLIVYAPVQFTGNMGKRHGQSSLRGLVPCDPDANLHAHGPASSGQVSHRGGYCEAAPPRPARSDVAADQQPFSDSSPRVRLRVEGTRIAAE